MSRHRGIAGLALLVLGAACGPETAHLSPADQDAIRAQIERYRQTALARDYDAWGQTLATDVVFSPANIRPLVGREATVAWVRTFPRMTGFTLSVAEITGRGDLAYVRGSYNLVLTLPDSSAATDRGAFFNLVERQAGGTWLFKRVMFHSTEPIPPGPAAPR